MKVIAIGEVLWDIFPDAKRIGGAPLNFVVNLVRLGNEAIIVSGVGDDALGNEALVELAVVEVETRYISIVPNIGSGTAVVSKMGSGETFAIPRPAAFDYVNLSADQLHDISEWNPDWIYVGTLAQGELTGGSELYKVKGVAPSARVFCDLNLRDGHWTHELVDELSSIADVLKLNEHEARLLHGRATSGGFSVEGFCMLWSDLHLIDTIAVTQGPLGCSVLHKGEFFTGRAVPTIVADTVGAGDAFSAGFLHGFHLGWPVPEVAIFANAMGSVVASMPGATPKWNQGDLERAIAIDTQKAGYQ